MTSQSTSQTYGEQPHVARIPKPSIPWGVPVVKDDLKVVSQNEEPEDVRPELLVDSRMGSNAEEIRAFDHTGKDECGEVARVEYKVFVMLVTYQYFSMSISKGTQKEIRKLQSWKLLHAPLQYLRMQSYKLNNPAIIIS